MAKTLSRAAFDRAAQFMREEARPLERALFAYYFEKGSRTRVLAALDIDPEPTAEGGNS